MKWIDKESNQRNEIPNRIKSIKTTWNRTKNYDNSELTEKHIFWMVWFQMMEKNNNKISIEKDTSKWL